VLEAHAGTLKQARALLVEELPALELRLQQARQRHHAAHVASTNRRALVEHDRKQPAGRHELRVEVGDHVAAQDRVGVFDNAAHGFAPSEGSSNCVSWSAIPVPPEDIRLVESACGSICA